MGAVDDTARARIEELRAEVEQLRCKPENCAGMEASRLGLKRETLYLERAEKAEAERYGLREKLEVAKTDAVNACKMVHAIKEMVDKEREKLEQFARDVSDGFECLPGCDSIAHEELCPQANPVAAWRELHESLRVVREAFTRWNHECPQTCDCSACDNLADLDASLDPIDGPQDDCPGCAANTTDVWRHTCDVPRTQANGTEDEK